jgi:molybdopterin-guanine dinucleotide biosynthesis protein A
LQELKNSNSNKKRGKMINRILVIMAGGKSSRMETDKALLPFNGYNSLAEYQYERFKPFFSKVYISAKKNKFDFTVDIIEDCYSDSSPLVGLLSIFETLKDIDEVAVLSVDSPFMNIESFNALFNKANKGSSVVVSESPNGLEPLCAIYRKSILPVGREMLTQNQHRLQRLLDRVQTQKVLFSDKTLFMNLNYPLDYELAKTFSSNI